MSELAELRPYKQICQLRQGRGDAARELVATDPRENDSVAMGAHVRLELFDDRGHAAFGAGRGLEMIALRPDLLRSQGTAIDVAADAAALPLDQREVGAFVPGGF